MVQLMNDGESGSGTEKMGALKMEVEDLLEEEHGPLQKRPKQQSLGMSGFAASASEYNPLDEPSPLGLRLRKSPSLLELIQMKLSQSNSPKVGSQSQGKKSASNSVDKLKASNFPGSVLQIGTWEYKSRYEGDLVAKCYFAKHKLVWEVLDGGLKNKIEIQWSDIMALKATYPDDGPGTLDVVLARQPLFFRETNPQPRKHTLWQATSDFTGGQASVHRRHYLECPQGLLGKHFEKLTQCDPRLNYLSQQGEITLDNPYFESKAPAYDEDDEHGNEFDLNREGSPSLFGIHVAASPSKGQSSSSKNDVDALSRHCESYPRETPSPSSDRIGPTVEELKNGRFEQPKELSNWDQIRVPGLQSSMSMTDLVSHLENRISKQGTCNKPTLSNQEWESLHILDDIKRCLFSDIQHSSPHSYEKSLRSRVDSLCCVLQKNNASDSIEPIRSSHSNSTYLSLVTKKDDDDLNTEMVVEEKCSTTNDPATASMPRKDSVGDLLLNLPRIASLPKFLLNIPEDYENQAR